MSLNFDANNSSGRINKKTIMKQILMLLIIKLFIFTNFNIAASADSFEAGNNDLDELLHTETVIIEQLNAFVKTLEQRVKGLKSKTSQIKSINEAALKDTENYVSNPIHAIKLLRRFTTDWQQIRDDAIQILQMNEIFPTRATLTNIKAAKFPKADNLEDAAANLLRIQTLYNLQTNSLAAGEIQGVKVGSGMSWNDCLQIGRISENMGETVMAKYWLDMAVHKFEDTTENNNLSPTTANETSLSPPIAEENTIATFQSKRNKFELQDALVANAYKQGKLNEALTIAEQMLTLKPKHKGVIKNIEHIKKAIRNNKATRQNEQQQLVDTPNGKIKGIWQQQPKSNTTRQRLIERLCVTTSHTPIGTKLKPQKPSLLTCKIDKFELPELTLQPLHVEILSLDPFIAIYHNVIHQQQINQLANYLATTTSEEKQQNFKFNSKFNNEIKKQLLMITGHATSTITFTKWQVSRRNYETTFTAALEDKKKVMTPNTELQNLGGIVFNLQQPTVGGGIIFPKLQLRINLPQLSLLYFLKQNLSNQHDDDRSALNFCPIVAGTQIVATADVEMKL